MNSRPAHPRRLTPELLVTVVIAFAYVAWLISIPAWPSQDGPIHLYYTHILSVLLAHQPSPYTHFYFIKHLLPPYALYYYALLVLSKLVSLLLADRIILCVYLVLFIFGFRFLAMAVGPGAERSTLLVVLLALNWSAGIGFLNYCLSLALVFWALGIWLRFRPGRHGLRLLFLSLVALIMLTHPVPLLILLAFCAINLVWRWVQQKRAGKPDSLGSLLPDLAVFFISLLTLVYVRHFATAHPLADTQPPSLSFLTRTELHVRSIVELHHISLVFSHSLPYVVYRFGQLATLVIGFALAITQRIRNRAAGLWTAGDTWLVLSFAVLFIVPLLPSDINDAFYFSERLSILLWIVPLIASSGWSPRRNSGFLTFIPAFLVVFAIVTNLCLLWGANKVIRPLANEVAAASVAAPVVHPGELVIVLEDPRSGANVLAGPSWNPYAWFAVQTLRHDNAVLDNAPWLDSAIIPLGATDALPIGSQATGNSASPRELTLHLLASPSSAAGMLSPADAVVVTQAGPPDSSSAEMLLNSSPTSGKWACRFAARQFQLCRRTAANWSRLHLPVNFTVLSAPFAHATHTAG